MYTVRDEGKPIKIWENPGALSPRFFSSQFSTVLYVVLLYNAFFAYLYRVHTVLSWVQYTVCTVQYTVCSDYCCT